VRVAIPADYKTELDAIEILFDRIEIPYFEFDMIDEKKEKKKRRRSRNNDRKNGERRRNLDKKYKNNEGDRDREEIMVEEIKQLWER
jgi:hypothetical protein